MESHEASGAAKMSERVLDLFELLLNEPEGLSLREVGRRLRIPLSSLHKLSGPLVSRRYVVRNEHSLLKLGPKLVKFAAAYLEGSELVGSARFIMQEIVRLSGATVFLAALDEGDTVCLHNEMPASAGLETARVDGPVGSRHPAFLPACGKAILAWLPEGDVAKLYPSETIIVPGYPAGQDRQALLDELAAVRATGLAHADPETTGGAYGVGSAIMDHLGQPIAGISVASVKASSDLALRARLDALIRAAARLVSYRLGFPEPERHGLTDSQILSRVWAGEQPLSDW